MRRVNRYQNLLLAQDPESQKRAAAANERKLLLRKAEAEEQLQACALNSAHSAFCTSSWLRASALTTSLLYCCRKPWNLSSRFKATSESSRRASRGITHSRHASRALTREACAAAAMNLGHSCCTFHSMQADGQAPALLISPERPDRARSLLSKASHMKRRKAASMSSYLQKQSQCSLVAQ